MDGQPQTTQQLTLAAGEVTYPLDQARLAVAGYAFATRTITTRRVAGHAFPAGAARRWGYRSYDCVPAGDADQFSELDLLVSAGLNADLDVTVLENLRYAARLACEPLGRAVRQAAARGLSFWDLTSDEVGSTPLEGSIGAELNEAWAACVAVSNIRVARTHKLLHHKAPHLVPLIDRITGPVLTRAAIRRNCDGSWQVVHADLHQHGFSELEQWFGEIAKRRSETTLTRLRIHDILLWLDTAGQRPAVIQAGRRCLERDRWAG